MMSQLIYLKDVVTLRLDQKKCIGCGICLLVCPHAVLSLTNGKIEIASRDACMECGACARNCPAEALNVRSGVGCAVAVINAMLGRKKSSCCCVVDSEVGSSDPSECSQDAKQTDCC
ncbi:MAG: 4Fe-4S binding protein [Desulfobacterales bacterium]|nr:4Fe-4S binding protein [Desulfobacterales bacterium]